MFDLVSEDRLVLEPLLAIFDLLKLYMLLFLSCWTGELP